MVNLVRSMFQTALYQYTNKDPRGYRFGLFSSIRHSYQQHSGVTQLNASLEGAKDDDVIDLVNHYFHNSPTAFHRHSFNSYMLDQLEQNSMTNDYNWSQHRSKPVKKFKGLVYRGTSTPPEIAFVNGFQARESSEYLEDYIKHQNGSVGISTTKRFKTAVSYALNAKRARAERFVYVIDYQGDNGFDIVESGNLSNHSVVSFFKSVAGTVDTKAEVNIGSDIDATQIKGAFRVTKNEKGEIDFQWIDNPNSIAREQNDMKLAV